MNRFLLPVLFGIGAGLSQILALHDRPLIGWPMFMFCVVVGLWIAVSAMKSN